MGLFALFNTAMAAQGAASKRAVTPAPEAPDSPRTQSFAHSNNAAPGSLPLPPVKRPVAPPR